MWDKETTFSDKQTLADGDSENLVDSGGDDFGLGNPVYLQVALTPGCTGSLAVSVKTSGNREMDDAATVAQYLVAPERVARGGVILAAPLPTGCKRYLKLAYAGAANGKITAGLVAEAQTSSLR